MLKTSKIAKLVAKLGRARSLKRRIEISRDLLVFCDDMGTLENNKLYAYMHSTFEERVSSNDISVIEHHISVMTILVKEHWVKLLTEDEVKKLKVCCVDCGNLMTKNGNQNVCKLCRRKASIEARSINPMEYTFKS